MIPHKETACCAKLIYGIDHVNFLFYEKSPGVPMPNPTDLQRSRTRLPRPGFAW
jgi:hypothetical protein